MFYGWRLVAGLFVILAFSSGLGFYNHAVFIQALADSDRYSITAASSAVSVFFYQGCITMGASFLKQFLTGPVISQMSAVGGLLIVAMAFNMLDMVKIKVANLLPAIFLPLLYFMLVQLFQWVFP